MNHELRTPLNTIIGPVDMLKDEVSTDFEKDMLHMIRESSAHLLGIIDDILSLSRIESGKLQLNLEAIDIREVLMRRLRALTHLALKKNLEFEIRFDESVPPRVKMDIALMVQALYNLIGNAIKFTATGGVVVDVSAESVSRRVKLTCVLKSVTPASVSRLKSNERSFCPSYRQTCATTGCTQEPALA